MSDDLLESPMLQLMRRYGIPLTRGNYVTIAYMGDPPSEADWSAEDEAQLPGALQDWQQFERGARRARRRP
jgi:hypothetical protein